MTCCKLVTVYHFVVNVQQIATQIEVHSTRFYIIVPVLMKFFEAGGLAQPHMADEAFK